MGCQLAPFGTRAIYTLPKGEEYLQTGRDSVTPDIQIRRAEMELFEDWLLAPLVEKTQTQAQLLINPVNIPYHPELSSEGP